MPETKFIRHQQVVNTIEDLLRLAGIEPRTAPLPLVRTSVDEVMASGSKVFPTTVGGPKSSQVLWLIGEEELLWETVVTVQATPAEFQQGGAVNTAKIVLAICLDLPNLPSTKFAEAIAAHTDQILLADVGRLNPDRFIEWLSCFAQAGMIISPHLSANLLQSHSLLLCATEWPPMEAIAHLSYALRLTGQQTLREQQVALDYQHHWAEVAQLVIQLQQTNEGLRQQLQDAQSSIAEFNHLKSTPAYRLLQSFQQLRALTAPPNSQQDHLLSMFLGWLAILDKRGVKGLVNHLKGELNWRSRALRQLMPGNPRFNQEHINIEPIKPRPLLTRHTAKVEIVICIHNAPSDMRRCLNSIQQWTTLPYGLILVDDGSAPETRDFLANFANQQPGVTLLRSEQATGYTRAANRGLRATSADFVILLNSDTIVTEKWLDRLIACATSDPTIGMVGPLSNTASWQSIPEVSAGDDWATNPLPSGVSLERWGDWLAEDSARLYPSMSFLNGFCLLIKREILNQVGFFDEEVFGEGYGEENDYALRVQNAGWRLALADDTYIYHAQSRSYSHALRQELSDKAAVKLSKKYNPARIEADVYRCRHDPVLVGIRARSAVLAERNQLIERGRRLFGGRRLLFVLPLDGPAGGGNVVVAEGEAMQRMGVDVQIFNLNSKRAGFETAFSGSAIPQIWGEQADVATISQSFDAVVATWHESVSWIAPAVKEGQGPIPGYYIQDFEPFFYEPESDGYRAALSSYREISHLRRFTKTAWTQEEVYRHTGARSTVVGPSIDINRFRPRPNNCEHDRIRITAMVRPSSPRRAPRLTMEVLERLWKVYGEKVEITLFGVDARDPGFAELPQKFDWRLAGVLGNDRVATLMSQTDIFVDFSTYQAMGLTALEAMASGAAVIVPGQGGSGSFARHQQNALVVDTTSDQACWKALARLVEDQGLHTYLTENAIRDAVAFYPEKSAFQILSLLFSANPRKTA